MKQLLAHVVRRLIIGVSVLGLLLAYVPHPVAAQTLNAAPTAKVSFTFDDGLASTFTQAQPILSSHGLVGTDYVITNCVGKTAVPNSCRANGDTPYMSWAQIQALQNTYGWEIGSHTVDHKCLASSSVQDPDDCQRTALTPAQLDTELSGSKTALAANGINAVSFAPPYGDYNNAVIAQIAKYYASMRGFKDQNTNVWPYDDYLLNNAAPQETVDTVASIEAKVDAAIANNTWLVLTFHDISATPSTNPDDYEYGTTELDQIAAYVAAKQAAGQIQSVRVNDGLVQSDTNLLSNGTFNSGIASGWTTDDAADVTADAGSNGSYPDPTNAVKLASPASGSAHLFSPKINVDPYATYMFKNFLNLQAITSGQVAFYVDEYDLNGNWISGQYLKQETSAFVENMNFTYTPSSVAVSKASLQVIAGGSGLTAYLDNAQLFPLSTAVHTNLVANGTFDDGIADGWTTNAPDGITADTGSNGGPANPANSVAFTAGATNTHLFSPHVPVVFGINYAIANYADVRNLTVADGNELGFYMDEYDASGNWISGQYITGVRSAANGDVGFSYTPSSADVATASLQVIVVGNSGLSGYFDDVRWYQN